MKLQIPRHIAIIMDGNGRWAKKKGLPRIEGHRAGIKSVRDIVKACGEWGVKYLTLYSFSIENWKRPATEIKALMMLLKFFLKAEVKELMENNVRLSAIGRLDNLPRDVRKELDKVMDITMNNQGLNLILALSYGARAEIVDAARAMVKDIIHQKIDEQKINEDLFSSYLYTRSFPDPDLLIRTSGELRISNFLLWQISYAEIWVTDALWPDFTRDKLMDGIKDFSKRERRFGGI